MGLTPNYAWPTPELSDPANVPADLKALADAADASMKTVANTGVPVGTLAMWLGVAAPAQWLLCQGQTNIPAVDYPVLASVLGQSGGFVSIPNLKGRLPIGLDAAQTEFDALKETGGAKTVTLDATMMPAHTHGLNTLSVPSHGHTLNGSVTAAADHAHNMSASGRYVAGISQNATWHQSYARGWDGGVQLPIVFYDDGATLVNIGAVAAGGAHGHADTFAVANAGAITPTGTLANTGGGQAHPNLPPYFVVNFIVKADH